MNVALVIAGGSGQRMGQDIPKQYLMVLGKPILVYCLEVFEQVEQIDVVYVVAAARWQPAIRRWAEDYGLRKLRGFADAGASRQHSIWNGLRQMKQAGVPEDGIVVVHDAVRPCVEPSLLRACIAAAEEADGAMPVLAVKDTVYRSTDGRRISELLDRDELYAGQAPESFRFGKYYSIHEAIGEEALGSIRGSSEIAHRFGLDVRLLPGDEGNYKITTPADLQKFCRQIEGQREKT